MLDNVEYSQMMIKSWVSVGDRFVHYIRQTMHTRIDLYDLAPDELKKKIEMRLRNYWKVYVFGFIKQEIENENKIYIPDYLKRMVLCYYTDLD